MSELLRDIGWPGIAVFALVTLFVVTLAAVLATWRWLTRHQERVLAQFMAVASRAKVLPMMRPLAKRYPRAWRFVSQRFGAGEYLGLHLTLGFLISLGAFVAFTKLASDVVDQEQIVRFDYHLAAVLHGAVTPQGLRFFSAVTALGSSWILVPLWIVVGLLLAVARRWFELIAWAACLSGAGLLSLFMKLAFQRARPASPLSSAAGWGWSFPSGHALTSLVTLGMLAFLLSRMTRSAVVHWLIVGSAGSLALMVGASRLYLGVHYFSDVVAGYAVGTFSLAVCITGFDLARRRPGNVTNTRPS